MPFIAAGIGVAGAIGGGLISAGAAKGAAGQQAGASNYAATVGNNQFLLTNQQMQPFVQSGTAAQGALNYLEGTGGPTGATTDSLGQGYLASQYPGFQSPGQYQPPAPFSYPGYQPPAPFSFPSLSLPQFQTPAPFSFTQNDFQQSPGYQFQLQQGVQAAQNAASARGDALGGNTLKALDQYGTGLANQDWYNAQNQARQNYTTNYNTALGGYGANVGTDISQYGANYQNAANAYNTNYQVGANAYNTNYQNAANAYNTNYQIGANAYNTNYNNLFNQYTTGYNQSQNQKNMLLGYLQNASGSGQNAAAQLGSLGASNAQSQANLITGAGNAQAAGTIGAGNAFSNALTGVGNNLGALALQQPNFGSLFQGQQNSMPASVNNVLASINAGNTGGGDPSQNYLISNALNQSNTNLMNDPSFYNQSY